MIHLNQVSVWFNRGTPMASPALNQLQLEVPAHQFVTLIGSNGAGKSTLLNVISGEIQPDQGEVWIGAQNITQQSTPQRARLIARVFQNPLAGSCADLTVAENLALAYRRGQSRSLGQAVTPKREAFFRDALAQLGLGLETRLRDRMGLLSGGQRQAICLLMATLAPHQVLLLDEHTAALDPKTAAEILQITRQLVEQHRLTVIMVTHSMRQALALGDRTILLHQGKIAFDFNQQERQSLTAQDLLDRFDALQMGN